MANITEIEELVKARQPIIWINSYEERRIIDELISSTVIGIEKVKNADGDEIEQISSKKKLYIWSLTQGIVRLQGSEWKEMDTQVSSDKSTFQPVGALQHLAEEKPNQDVNHTILIMRDMHQLMNMPVNVRKLRDLTLHFSRSNKTIILIGPCAKIPDELQKDIYMVDYDFPTADHIDSTIRNIVSHISKTYKNIDKTDDRYAKIPNSKKRYRVNYTDTEINSIVHAAQGLTQQEIKCSLSKSIHNTDNGEIEYDRIALDKKNIISKSQVLEFITTTEPFGDVGGNDAIKGWLQERGMAVNGDAVKFGVRQPKGCLITGVQGAGKSMICKAIANEWKIPLIKLDMGRVFAGLVGSSEKNMRDVIAQAEAMSPCILYVDEIEKGLSGTGSSNMSDGGTSSRVFGTFISWLNDKTKPVFVIATANSIEQLPPELFRKGRFDAIWFVDLPTEKERSQIYSTHIGRTGRDASKFDLKKLAKVQYKSLEGNKYNYSGSEIEEAINDALFTVYCRNTNNSIIDCPIGDKKDINTKDIIKALNETIPISCTAESKIKKIRKWGQKNAKFASSDAEGAFSKSIKPVKTKAKEDDDINIYADDIM